MSVATGIAPDALLELDGRLFDELEQALVERWSTADELAAATLETTHALLRAFLTVHSKKGARPMPALVIPRPGDPSSTATGPARVTPSGFAALIGGRNVTGVEAA